MNLVSDETADSAGRYNATSSEAGFTAFGASIKKDCAGHSGHSLPFIEEGMIWTGQPTRTLPPHPIPTVSMSIATTFAQQIIEEAVAHFDGYGDAFAELVRLGVATDPTLADPSEKKRRAASSAAGRFRVH